MGDEEKDKDNPFGNMPNFGLDINELWASLRQAAWIKTGAVMFGGAVGEYRRTLIENGISDDDAMALTAKTIEEIVKGLATVASAAVSTFPAAMEARGNTLGGKEMPS